MDNRENARRALLDLIARAEQPIKLKRDRRDRREPGRRQKEDDEDRLTRIIRRWLRWQSDRVEEVLHQRGEWANKAAYDDWFDERFWQRSNDDIVGTLTRLFERAAQGGVELFATQNAIGFDTTLANTAAAAWARQHAGKLITDLTKTTQESLRQALETFVTTPGYTIGDVMASLDKRLFDERRARMVAVTEITSAYAEGNQAAAEQLQKELPRAKIVKQWYTNVDDLVCDICKPLDGLIVRSAKDFKAPGDISVFNPPAHPNCRCWTQQYVEKL